MKPIFTKAREEDIPALFSLYEERTAWMAQKGLHQWNTNDYLQVFDLPYYLQECRQSHVYVLTESGRVLGGTVLTEADESWQDTDSVPALYIHNLVTACGEHGLGRLLMQSIESLALSMGKTCLRLDCDRQSAFLTDYYTMLGFEPCGECVYEPYHGVLWQKKLPAAGQIRIRNVTPRDAAELLDIYAWYVTDTAVTFEYEVPSLQEFTGRIEHIQKRYPYLALEEETEEGRRILGYAYAGAFHARAAYDWCAEMTIYLRHDLRGRGLGSRLYSALEEALRQMGILNLYACIGYPKQEDEYLTQASARYHQRMGYRLNGTFTDSGFKFNRWYDMIWMEKMIGEHRQNQPPVIAWKECPDYCEYEVTE